MAQLLIIENNPDIRELLTLSLQPPHAVTAVATGVEAQELCQARMFEVAVVNVILPGMQSGTEFGRALLAIAPDTRLLFISGLPVNRWREFDRVNIDQLPPQSHAVLQKPFLPSELRDAVDALLVRQLRGGPPGGGLVRLKGARTIKNDGPYGIPIDGITASAASTVPLSGTAGATSAAFSRDLCPCRPTAGCGRRSPCWPPVMWRISAASGG